MKLKLIHSNNPDYLKLKESFEQREDLKNWNESFNGYLTEMVQYAEVD